MKAAFFSVCLSFLPAIATPPADPFKDFPPLIEALSKKNDAFATAENLKKFLETANNIALETIKKSGSAISDEKLQNFKEDFHEKILSAVEDLYQPIDTD